MTISLRNLFATSAVLAVLPFAAAHAAVTISTSTTSNMSCVSGVCTPTAANAVLNVGDLTTMLASGKVTVNTGSGSLAQQVEDIIVAAPFNWASANALTLDAWHSVTINASVAVNGSAPVSLVTNDGGSGGNLSFPSGGSLSFMGTSNGLTINGTAYTLENSIAALASAVSANPGGTFALANNYDASRDGTYSSCPIATTVGGAIEGLGNTISNLSIHTKSGRRAPSAALIEGVAGVVENLRLTGIRYEVKGKNTGAGGLTLLNDGYLLGDEVEGSIIAHSSDAGGLVAGNRGTIVASSANVRIKAYGWVGGLTPWNEGSISQSHAKGDVSGLITGGLVAYNYLAIDQSYATGDVKGGGGLVAYNYGDAYPGPTITNSYATGNSDSAGFVYEQESNVGGEISSSYATGSVSKGGNGFESTWSGSNEVADDYWDTTTSGTKDGVGGGNIPGITGLTTKQFKSGLPSGFDATIWAENPSINNGLPYLINNPPQ
jgi:hypothetical protein